MVASLDGFIARRDGGVDWLETSDKFEDGAAMTPEFVAKFLKTIDCYVMGSRTYETALEFDAEGFGLLNGNKPTFILTSRELPRARDTVEVYSGDLARLVNERLKPAFRVFGSLAVVLFPVNAFASGSPTRFGIRSPILIGGGISFFEGLDKDIALNLVEVKAYESGRVALRHEVRK